MKTRWIFVRCLACVVFSCGIGFRMQAESVRAATTPGRIVWWEALFPRSGHSNAVLKVDSEIVTNAIAIGAVNSAWVVLKSDSTVTCAPFRSLEGIPTSLSNVVSMSWDDDTLWSIRRDGTVLRSRFEPERTQPVPGLSNIITIASQNWPRGHFAVDRGGALLAFRICENEPRGEMLEDGILPVRVNGQAVTNVAAITPVNRAQVVLMRDGSVHSLGYRFPNQTVAEPYVDDAGRLMYYPGGAFGKTPYEYLTFKPVTWNDRPLTNIVAISGALALARDGWVFGFDDADEGETARLVAGLTNIAALAPGGANIVLRSNGTVISVNGDQINEHFAPEGLSNVVFIATAETMALAITTGNISSSVYIHPDGRLEEMEREADLIFKGRVISTQAVTNNMFPEYAKTHATRFEIISVLKGSVATNEITFWHFTQGPGIWGGGAMPSWHRFKRGESYLVFAAKMDRPEYLYTAPPDATNRINEFRQLYRNGVMRTLGARPLEDTGVKESHWRELGLLLHDANPTNQLYAIANLDWMSLPWKNNYRSPGILEFGQWNYFGPHSLVFRREEVLQALLPLTTNGNEEVATGAIACFAVDETTRARQAAFVDELVKIANEGPSSNRRLTAIEALPATANATISNSLSVLLKDPEGAIRERARARLHSVPD